MPPDALADCAAAVIGVGAVGRQVAIQLAAMGVPFLLLYDHDWVGVENLAAQGYWASDLGERKVAQTADLCRQHNPDLVVSTRAEKFVRGSGAKFTRAASKFQTHAMFLCVDKIETRAMIFQEVKAQASLIVDGRMAGEVLRVLAVDRPKVDDYYETTLFTAAEAHQEACTSRSTLYAACVTAGMMVSQLARFLRNIRVERDQLFNMFAAELSPL